MSQTQIMLCYLPSVGSAVIISHINLQTWACSTKKALFRSQIFENSREMIQFSTLNPLNNYICTMISQNHVFVSPCCTNTLSTTDEKLSTTYYKKFECLIMVSWNIMSSTESTTNGRSLLMNTNPETGTVWSVNHEDWDIFDRPYPTLLLTQ